MPESARWPGHAPATGDTHIFPLKEFYTRAGLALPRVEIVPGERVPEPYKTLLVHSNDMTPTLEGFHKSEIHLEILSRERRGDFYFREVVLRLNGSEQAVEFGANKVYVARLPEEAQDLILQEQMPLGRVLRECGVRHRTEAKAFLRVESDGIINQSFGLDQTTELFGRKAVISDTQGRPLSEIVEILPPIQAG
jgi:chorismate-pyruvate lyase